METIIFYLVGVAMAALVSLMTIAVIRKSYREILEELCGTAQRAGYWVRMSEVCLVVITVFSAITFHGYQALDRPGAVELFWDLMGQVSWILAAVFASLTVIAFVVVRSLPREGKRIVAPKEGVMANPFLL